MNKKILLITAIFALTVIAFSSCTKDDPQLPVVDIDGIIGTEISVPQDDVLTLTAKIESVPEVMSIKWTVNGTEKGAESTFKFSEAEVGDYTVGLTVTNKDGESSSMIKVSVYGKYRDGVYVLNEGNMTSENGFITFITEKGDIIDSAYFKVNGSSLGNVTQDMYIADKKLYVIAQNGNRDGSDGILVIADAETLKKSAAYNDELSTLSWPTHIAVIGNNAYIRDNAGVYLFNLSTKQLTFIEGSKGALKNRMAVVGKKVFVPANKSIYVIEDGATKVNDTIKFTAAVSGVLASKDGNLWVSNTSSPAQISKVSSSDYSIIKSNELPAEAKVGAGWGATPGISAKGDTLYFSNASTTIYRHIFGSNQTTLMVNVKDHIENAGIVYNNLAVHPVTGNVYFNTIKGYGLSFLINDISVWSDTGSVLTLKEDYKDHTHFPAGIFFTDSYK